MRPAGRDLLDTLIAGNPPAKLRRIHDLKKNLVPYCDRPLDRTKDQQISLGRRASVAICIGQRQRDTGEGIRETADGIALANPASACGPVAEMPAERRMSGAASGLIGGNDDGCQWRAEQRPRQTQSLKLRIRA